MLIALHAKLTWLKWMVEIVNGSNARPSKTKRNGSLSTGLENEPMQQQLTGHEDTDKEVNPHGTTTTEISPRARSAISNVAGKAWPKSGRFSHCMHHPQAARLKRHTRYMIYNYYNYVNLFL